MTKAEFVGENIPKTKRVSLVPGDNLLETMEKAVDTAGRTWPKGTRCRGLAGGYSNVFRADYVEMTMLGESS